MNKPLSQDDMRVKFKVYYLHTSNMILDNINNLVAIAINVQCIASWLTTFASVKIQITQAWIKAVTDKVMKLTDALL